MDHVNNEGVSNESTVGRRELLKALAAGGAAITAAGFLPGKWAEPVVEAGVLPAHAQTSDLRIQNLRFFGPGLDSQDVDFWPDVYFDYTDGLCQVDEQTRLFVITNPGNELQIFSGEKIVDWVEQFKEAWFEVEGKCQGTIGFFLRVDETPVEISVYIMVGDRTSNILPGTFEFEGE